MLTAQSYTMSDGSVTAPSYSFLTETNTGFYLSAIGELSFSINGIQRLVCDLTLRLFSLSVSTNALSGYQKIYIDSTTNTLSRYETSKVDIEDATKKIANVVKTIKINSSLSTSSEQQKLDTILQSVYLSEQTAIDTAYSYPNAINGFPYHTAAYHPILNRVYLIPWDQAPVYGYWHYMDENGITSYLTGLSTSQFSGRTYAGGAWDPTKKRLYMSPYRQGTGTGGSKTNFHYIDENGTIVGYAHNQASNIPSDGAYFGCVYHPVLNRIYLVPHNAITSANWLYIDCATTTVVAYANTATVKAANSGYRGGFWDYINQRIWFVPFLQAEQTKWHYIDSSGAIGEYTHGATIPAGGSYSGGAYHAKLKRYYFTPFGISNSNTWHYLDCQTGNIIAYTHSASAVQYAYQGAAYAFHQQRVYFSAYDQAGVTTRHYIDSTGTLTNYTVSAANSTPSGVLHPSGKIFTATYSNSGSNNFLDVGVNYVNPSILAYATFNCY